MVKKQLETMRLRNTHPAFSKESTMSFYAEKNTICIEWTKDEFKVGLEADLKTFEWKIY